MENSFKSLIEQSGSLVIFLPTTPRLDQVASGLSLYLALKDIKPVQIISASDITVSFNRLIGVDKISGEVGNKNLVIGFSNYDANGIEKVSYDIIGNQFKLTVIPKQSVTPPKEDQVKISYEGVSADTVLLIGGLTDAHFPQLASSGLESAKVYHIGTKPLTVDPSKVIYTFSQPLASVSELTFLLLNEAALSIDGDCATNLLMGIEEATQNYKSQEVSADTFEITASLIRAGGRRLSGETPDKSKYPQGSIPEAPVKPVNPAPQVSTQVVSQTDFADFSNPKIDTQNMTPQTKVEETKDENEEVVNPPDDWLAPKVFRGTSLN